MATYLCPTRRPVQPYPVPTSPWYLPTPLLSDATAWGARNCYVANGGIDQNIGFGPGPDSLEQGLNGSYDSEWPDLTEHFGIVANRSEVRIRDITDGTSKTYLVGEKYINPDAYVTGRDPATIKQSTTEVGATWFDSRSCHRNEIEPPPTILGISGLPTPTDRIWYWRMDR